MDCECSIAFGHNLLSVYDSNQRLSKPQPVSNDNLTLIFDGQLYNFPTIRNLVVKVGVCEEINSDADALLYLIEFYCKKMELLEAVKSAVKLIDGDYAFAVWNGENLAIVRDPLGVKPLFYAQNDEFSAFASTKQSLKSIGFDDIKTLKPEHILYDWIDVGPSQPIYEKNHGG